MADNAQTGTGVPVATDKVTYSGDADQNVQLVRPVLTTGAEGAKTVVDLPGDATYGLDADITRVPAPLNVVGEGTGATALRVALANDLAGSINVEVQGRNTPPDWVAVRLVTGTDYITALPVTDNGSTLSIDDGAGSITVDGTVAVSGSVAVTDNAGSLTVDAPVGTPVFVRLSDGASPITTLPVSLSSVPSHAVTNAGTFAVQVDGNALTALQLLDDVVVADNAGFTDGTTKLSMAGYIYDEVAGTALTENDAAAARINANRAQVATIEDGATRGRYATVSAANALKVDGSAVTQPVSIAAAVAVTDNSGSLTVDDGGGSLTVDGTVAVSGNVAVTGTFWQATQPVSLASLPALAAGTNNIGDVDVLSVPAPLNVTGTGTEAAALRVTIATDSTGVLSVDDNGGSLTVDGTVAATQSGTWNITNVSGTVSLPTGAATETTLAALNTKHPSQGQALMAASVPVAIASNQSAIPVTDNSGSLTVDDGGGSLTVDGTVAVSGSVAVTGTFWQATQPVSLASMPAPLNVTGGGTEASALRVTLASDSTGVLSVDDNGGSLTVDGTVAVSSISSALPAGTNNIGDVDVLSVPAPLSTTGNGTAATALRVTLASDSTGVLAATQSGTWNIGTVTTLTGITNALPAGTNAIGKLAANSGVDIGDVDVTSIVPGTGATNLGKAEDAAHTSGDVGVMALAVRSDAGIALAGSNGDYTPLLTDAFGHLHVNPWPVGTIDSFGNVVTGTVNNSIDIQFYRDTPANLVTVTTGSGGTVTATGGMATFACTTTASSNAKGVSGTTTIYTAGAEIYAIWTAAFTGTGSGTSYQRIGLHDANNGAFISFEGGTFGVTRRTGASDTDRTAKASFNLDTLTGAAGSGFTRAGVPEAIDLTKLNVWRIRMGWVGSAPINFEVLSPDGNWVTFHTIRQPNSAATPSMQTADLPFTCEVNGGNSGAALSILTNCWCAGTTQRLAKVNATITANTLAELGRSVIVGESTGGGGSFVNVKVNPSGSLSTVLGANSGVDIGDVDVTSVIPGTGATNLGKAEDAAHSSGDVGVMALGVINFSGAGADADYAPVNLTSEGMVKVQSRSDLLEISVQSSGLTTSVTTYAAGDQVGTQFTLANAARASGGGGYITGVTLIDVNAVIGACDVAFFNASVTPASDNAAFSLSDADGLKLIQVVQLSGSINLGGQNVCQASGLAIPYTCSGGTSLYALVITRYANAVFAAATDLQLKVWVDRG